LRKAGPGKAYAVNWARSGEIVDFLFAHWASWRFNIRHMKNVLAYLGGLDASVLLSWIKDMCNAG
jgi:hypothetical protein